MKRVPIIVGRNDIIVGGRWQLLDDIDSEADAPVNVPQAGSVSNLPVDSDLDDAGGGGPGTDLESGYLFVTFSLLIHY